MTTEEHHDAPIEKTDRPAQKQKRHRRHWMALPAIGVALIIGLAGGAGAMKLIRPAPEMAPMIPTAISSMPSSGLVTIKGKVAEIYGNKFILQDDSGKALIETGPSGEGGKLVATHDTVTIQGRFDDGFVHASYLIDQDGKAEALRPAGPPPPRGLRDFLHKIAP